MKSDFDGHDNVHHDNIYGYIGRGFSICDQRDGHEDYFYNNYVVQTNDGNYGNPKCSGTGKTVVHDNKIFTPTGKVTECNMALKDWQTQGGDPGTTASTTPSDAELIQQIKSLLML